MKIIITGGKTYTATIIEDDNGLAVNVFAPNDKMPIYGTRFGRMASFETQIMPWITGKCEKHSKGFVETIDDF